jgi:diguanylate cyclase (GGDEF)-like protein
MGALIDGSDVQTPDFKQNISIAAPRVLIQLNELQDRNEAAPLWDRDQIERLREGVNQWIKASRLVISALESEVWRKDLQLLGETITPVLSRMREHCSRIDLRLDSDSATEITQLSQIARQLSDLILGIAVIGMLMILAAYLYINRTLLNPIAETAFALKEEARGTLDIKPPPAELREMQDLVDAFDEMRRQVRQRQRYLDHVAHHDALTQLPNRILFRDRLEHALAISLRGETQVGLMFLDLDQFKQVNDSLGHLVGDELLQTVAERLTALVRSSDTVARLGGDEFAILVEGINNRDDMSVLANKILRTIEKPMTLANKELRISVSVGIATAPHDDVSAEFLIRDADTAMYEAKRQGRAAYCFFSDEMTTKATESLQRETQVRQAAERNEFVFHFQPIIDCKHGQLFCFEALMRWRHPDRGIVHPAEFLNTLDDTGIIASVVDSLMWQAYSFQHDRYLQTGEKVAIAINLSVRLLNDRVFRKQLLERLVAHDFFKESLILEITEEILMQDLADADIFLQQTKALGARIALDDFGTGQASLSHLRQFPFDYLKIDRDFIRNVQSDKNDANVVQAMVELGHAFGIQVIAEGVENEAQLNFLQELGCDYVQGYLIGVPSHAEHQFEMSSLLPLFAN